MDEDEYESLPLNASTRDHMLAGNISFTNLFQIIMENKCYKLYLTYMQAQLLESWSTV
jgi:NADPH-dependent 7-cyano-7-deazaguanine reductase QueF-like protein